MNAVAAIRPCCPPYPTAGADPSDLRRARAAAVDDADVLMELERRPGLLAEVAVLLPDEVVAAIGRATAEIHAALAKRDGGRNHPGVLGFDFHLSPAGPKLIEVNTNPGGLLLVLAQQRAWGFLHPHLDPAGLEADRAEEAALDGFAPGAGKLALVDDDPHGQFLYPEFLLYRNGFRRRGLVADIVDGRHWSGGFDAVYNRLTDFALEHPDHAALAADWRAGRLALIPDPASHQAFADKRRLADLWRDHQGAPWAVPVFDGAWSESWHARHHLFFKPVWGYGGRGGYRGDKISRATWDRLDPAATLAQRLVPPPLLDNGFKLDVRAFAVDGRVLTLGGRLYRGQLTNFRTLGGGLAAIFRCHAD